MDGLSPRADSRIAEGGRLPFFVVELFDLALEFRRVHVGEFLQVIVFDFVHLPQPLMSIIYWYEFYFTKERTVELRKYKGFGDFPLEFFVPCS